EEAALERRQPREAAQLMWIPERQAPVGHAAIERLIEREEEDLQVHARNRDIARDGELDRPPETHEGGDAEHRPERARWPLLHLAGRRPSAPRCIVHTAHTLRRTSCPAPMRGSIRVQVAASMPMGRTRSPRAAGPAPGSAYSVW